MKNIIFYLVLIVGLIGCKNESSDSLESGKGEETIQMIPIQTPKGEFKVWTKRVGDNPTMKVLLLHGGPGMTHEQYGNFDEYLPQEGIEFIWYDQLGSAHSDQPEDSSLWTIERFVDEVEQVRKALGLNKDNFYLLGQSWGGMLGMEYAFRHQENLKGLIICNMMSSLDEYEKYAKEVLGPQMPAEVFAEIMEIEKNMDFENPRYMELLEVHHYPQHVLRMPAGQWPEEINRMMTQVNPDVYIYMQGYSEFGITPGASLEGWDVREKLKTITVPTLVVGGSHDTMDPKHMEWMSKQVGNGRFLLCPNGSHLSQYDDPSHFFPGLIKFIKDVDSGSF
ncbi:proline iminopeptidase [Algoriphagus ornithinivorans]|uniref:Proline iminopeptidase n=1 Tax=Algoriphagus ornithinivorans TaxID=226506 RepID=A0A1I5AGW2_9BACT|nr:proline iminopeptidase-family hydrolase [Algoriphagus ornithinivorans]SFN61677.1 proline iminopeptidase [Algoriphagus ornithinivorans]